MQVLGFILLLEKPGFSCNFCIPLGQMVIHVHVSPLQVIPVINTLFILGCCSKSSTHFSSISALSRSFLAQSLLISSVSSETLTSSSSSCFCLILQCEVTPINLCEFTHEEESDQKHQLQFSPFNKKLNLSCRLQIALGLHHERQCNVKWIPQ